MALTKAAALRIIDLNDDGQQSEIIFRDGKRIACTFRKRKKGGWRVEIADYPDGTRITTKGPGK